VYAVNSIGRFQMVTGLVSWASYRICPYWCQPVVNTGTSTF